MSRSRRSRPLCGLAVRRRRRLFRDRRAGADPLAVAHGRVRGHRSPPADPDGFAIEDGGGFLVGVTASIATEDNRVPEGNGTDTPTPAPSYDDEFVAWYHLTPRRVRRKDAGTGLPGTPEDADLFDATTVRCV